jgi:hypothetical protein
VGTGGDGGAGRQAVNFADRPTVTVEQGRIEETKPRLSERDR